MDPITHAVVGMALGVKGGAGLSLANGAMIASTLGAVAPDFDILTRFWGEFAYLKQHRGASHSLPGIIIMSFVLGGLLSFIYPENSFLSLWFWSIIGGISHSFLDLFNSYGVKVFWPLSRKKWTINLLMLFDPILFMLTLTFILVEEPFYSQVTLICTTFYIIGRLLMRHWAWRLVKDAMNKKYPTAEVIIMPARYNLLKWDFIVTVPGKNMVGFVDILKRRFRIVRHLKCVKQEINHVFSNTVLGNFFQEFTPFFHIECERVENKLIGRFMDLRYLVRGRFLHNGTLVLNQEMEVEEAFFQPFNLSHRINLQ